MTSPYPFTRLTTSLGRTVKREAKRYPHLTSGDVMKAFGVVAGALVAELVPPGQPERDYELGNLVGLGLVEGLKVARQMKAS